MVECSHTTVSIPKILSKQIDQAIARGFFTTKGDFVKTACRHELERQTLLDQRRKEQGDLQ
jgi:Arc/MetJ-type ribon-helix-helix transcriptional regulator